MRRNSMITMILCALIAVGLVLTTNTMTLNAQEQTEEPTLESEHADDAAEVAPTEPEATPTLVASPTSQPTAEPAGPTDTPPIDILTGVPEQATGLPATPTALSPAQIQQAPPAASTNTYTVRRGDTLYRIALRFNTTVNQLAALNGITNPRLIFVGQTLRIPGGAGTGGQNNTLQAQPTITPTFTPSATVVPPTATATAVPIVASEPTYTVRRGDTLYRIAIQNNTTISELVALNNIPNPNIVFEGQVLRLPGAASAPPQVSDGFITTDNQAIADAGFAYGIEVFYFGQDADTLTQQVTDLGLSWVKVRVDWRNLEPEQGNYRFDELDNIVQTIDDAEVNILMTVVNAPVWAREFRDENGPPQDLSTYTTFINELAQRYTGVVDAYQIWDEPNLRRSWNCGRRMCDTDYLSMLRFAFETIKAVDGEALVITAGLAPTRFNDRVNAIDDLLYLETLLANGAANISDAIGANPGGWANPPDAFCCEQPLGVESHYEDNSFYFLENLRNYRDIILRYNAADSPIWITEFGWGTSEDTDPPGEINSFVNYTSLAEQAIYVPRAFELAQELGYIGPMFVDNLNGCEAVSNRVEACYTSLIGPDGEPRPVFTTIRAIEKTNTSGDEPQNNN